MAGQQEIFDYTEFRGTIAGALDQMEMERNNLKAENVHLKKKIKALKATIEEKQNENTVLKTTMEEKENENRKLSEDLSAAKKKIDVLDPTGTGQRILEQTASGWTKEIDKLNEKITSLEAMNAQFLKMIDVLQRAELVNTTRTEGAKNGQPVKKASRKRRAETSLEVNAETLCNGK